MPRSASSELTTPRLLLRPPSVNDAAFIRAICLNPEARRYLGGPVDPSLVESKFKALVADAPEKAVWTVLTQPANSPIGLVYLDRYRDGTSLELSFQFDPLHWKHGYATEATQAVIAFARYHFPNRAIVAETQAANAASRRLLTRLGMAETGRIFRFGAEQAIFTLRPA